MITRRHAWFAATAALAAASAPRPARAQAAGYPDRPVRIVVPYSPGGANDILARLLGHKLGEALGQPFVVENRPGAQAIVGTEAVARAKPDGHTLLMGASGPLVFNPATYERLSYDPLRDFAPVSMVASFPLVLIVAGDAPFRDVRSLVDFARAHPDRANYGAVAASFQLPTELFNRRAGTAFAHVAYRGNADTVNAVAAGEVTMALIDTGPAAAPLAAGRVRALAVAAAERLAALPGVPTLAEAGFPGVEALGWSGLLAPAGTPEPITRRLGEEVARAVRRPDMAERLAALVMQPATGTPEAFADTVRAEIARWSAVARDANIRLER